MTILVCMGWGWGGGFWRLEVGRNLEGGWIPSTWTTDPLVEKFLSAYCVPRTKEGVETEILHSRGQY